MRVVKAASGRLTGTPVAEVISAFRGALGESFRKEDAFRLSLPVRGTCCGELIHSDQVSLIARGHRGPDRPLGRASAEDIGGSRAVELGIEQVSLAPVSYGSMAS